jgi:hypothetical protein
MMDEPTLQRTLRGPWPTESRYHPGLDAMRTGARRRLGSGRSDIVRTSGTPWSMPGSVAGDDRSGRHTTGTTVAISRLVAAIAIVALGTGAVLLAGGRVASPSATPSPSPVTWTPPPSLVTEEVAPGVLLTTDDGAGHLLRWQGGMPDSDFAFAPDGSIWLLHGSELIRMGDEGRYPGPRGGFDMADLTAAPDGTLWALSEGTVASFRDRAWVTAPAFPGRAPAKALEVLPDGTVWARSTTTLARLDGDSWVAFPIADDQGPIPDYEFVFPGGLAWTPDGSLWLTACRSYHEPVLLRFDGTRFHASPPSAQAECGPLLSTGPDGELWAWVLIGGGTRPRYAALARHDGTGWQVSPRAAGVPSIAAPGAFVGSMAVAPDGRLWAAGGTGDRGSMLGAFDGTVWTDVFGPVDPPVQGGGPTRVAPDGTVWLLTESGLLIIDPEEAMAGL